MSGEVPETILRSQKIATVLSYILGVSAGFPRSTVWMSKSRKRFACERDSTIATIDAEACGIVGGRG